MSLLNYAGAGGERLLVLPRRAVQLLGGPAKCHQVIRLDRRESEAPIELVSIGGPEDDLPNLTEIRMGEHRFDEPHSQATSSMAFEHEEVGDPGERRAVGDDPGKTHLLAVGVKPEYE